MDMFLIPKPHSVIDVITNSSSELFIFKSEKSMDTLKEILGELLVTYRKTSKYAETSEYFKDFDSAYGSIFVINEKTKKELLFDVMRNIMQYRRQSTDIYYANEFGLNSETYPKYEDYEDKKHFTDWDRFDVAEKIWMNKNMKNFIKTCKGMTVLYSKSDNSIPYGIIGFIEATFNAHRYHLG